MVLLKDKPANAYNGVLTVRTSEGLAYDVAGVTGAAEVDLFKPGIDERATGNSSVFGTRHVTVEELIDAVAFVDEATDALERLVRCWENTEGITAAAIDQAKRALARVGRA